MLTTKRPAMIQVIPLGTIVGRRDFHHIHPDDTVLFGDLLEYRRDLTIQEASGR